MARGAIAGGGAARLGDLTGGAEGLTIRRTLLRPPDWSGFTLGEKDQWLYWLTIVCLLLAFVVLRNIITGRYGMAMNAVRQNEIAAAASGVNIATVKLLSFAVSGAITGLAGSLFAMYIGSLFAEGSFTVLAGITLLIGLVVGGERTMLGPIIGGLIVVFLPYYTSDIGGGQFSAVLFAIVLIAVVFVAPDGIAGGLGRIIGKVVRVEARRPEGGRDGGLFGDTPSVGEPAGGAAAPGSARCRPSAAGTPARPMSSSPCHCWSSPAAIVSVATGSSRSTARKACKSAA